jgi:hypothetical protein
MKTHKFAVGCVVLAASMTLSAFGAQRIFVSATGDDTLPGSHEQPKRTFAQAINALDAGGEIVVLDSGGYGPVRVNKSASIIAPAGVYAGIRSNEGIIVDAPTATVVLRGLTVQGDGGAVTGINVNDAAAVHVENCIVTACTDGIVSRSTGRVFVKDTIVRGNSFSGIQVLRGQATLDGIEVEAGGHGLIAQFAVVAVSHCKISGNGGTGIFAVDGSVVNAEFCQVTNNEQDGIVVTSTGEPAVLRLSNSTVANNLLQGLVAGPGGTLESSANNIVRGNGVDVTGVLSTVPGT